MTADGFEAEARNIGNDEKISFRFEDTSLTPKKDVNPTQSSPRSIRLLSIS